MLVNRGQMFVNRGQMFVNRGQMFVNREGQIPKNRAFLGVQ